MNAFIVKYYESFISYKKCNFGNICKCTPITFLDNPPLKIMFLELSEKELQNNIFLFQTTTGIKAVIRIGKEN